MQADAQAAPDHALPVPADALTSAAAPAKAGAKHAQQVGTGTCQSLLANPRLCVFMHALLPC